MHDFPCSNTISRDDLNNIKLTSYLNLIKNGTTSLRSTLQITSSGSVGGLFGEIINIGNTTIF